MTRRKIHYTVRTVEGDRRLDRTACGSVIDAGLDHSGIWCDTCWVEARRRFWPELEATERADVTPQRVRNWMAQPLPSGWPQ